MIGKAPLRGRWGRNARNEAIVAALFLLPSLIGILVFTVGPVFASLWISLHEWNLLNPPEFRGLVNYRRLVEDPDARHALGVTLIYLGGYVPLSIVGALLLALAMNTKIRGISFFRAVYFIPVVSSTIAVGLMFRWVYNYEFGMLNYLLNNVFDTLHLPFSGPPWLSDPGWAMPAIILMSVWQRLGYNMVIFLAGLQGVSQHYYEAAMIDGAGRWHRFRHVTLPLLTPSIFFVLVISMIGAFQVFQQSYIMTSGGPARSTVTLVYYLYENAFEWAAMGYASAIAWLLFVLIFIVTLGQWMTQRNWVFYR